MREPNERASRNSRSFHRSKQWRSAKEKQRGNTSRENRLSFLTMYHLARGTGWISNRLGVWNISRWICDYKNENAMKQTMMPKRNIFWNEWWRINWRKRYRWWNECEESNGIEDVEIEIVGIWFNSFYLELCLKRWKGKFCLRIEEFWLRNEILFEELKRLHW